MQHVRFLPRNVETERRQRGLSAKRIGNHYVCLCVCATHQDRHMYGRRRPNCCGGRPCLCQIEESHQATLSRGSPPLDWSLQLEDGWPPSFQRLDYWNLDARLLEFTSVDYWRPGITGSEGKQNRKWMQQYRERNILLNCRHGDKLEKNLLVRYRWLNLSVMWTTLSFRYGGCTG